MWGVDEVLSACIIGTVMATSRARVPQTHGNDKGLLRSASGNWQSTSLLRVRRCTNDWPVHAKAGTWAPSSGCLQPEAARLPTELSYLLGCAQEVLWRSALTRRSGFGSVQNLAGCVVCPPPPHQSEQGQPDPSFSVHVSVCLSSRHSFFASGPWIWVMLNIWAIASLSWHVTASRGPIWSGISHKHQLLLEGPVCPGIWDSIWGNYGDGPTRRGHWLSVLTGFPFILECKLTHAFDWAWKPKCSRAS